MNFAPLLNSRRAAAEIQRLDTGLKTLCGCSIYIFEFRVEKPERRWPTAWSVCVPMLNTAAVNNEMTEEAAWKLADRVAGLTIVPSHATVRSPTRD